MKPFEMMQPEHIIFALDIGTRSVIGILGERDGDFVRIIDTEMIEHTKRAMIDGQIEDIAQVARVAKQVKEALEERNHISLTRVSVAAAGRALSTHRVTKQISLDHNVAIDEAILAKLESETLAYANMDMFGDEETMMQSQYYCVGYSVMKYVLDGYPISTLLGHRGKQVQIEMLVTFLPNEVVESLYATMASIDLEIESLTLEPIAAMNLVIPPDLRNLNLVLVDIGAGTSDIAISKEGSVVAYAMATTAGDELTEAISSAYVVDFHEAERIKHALSDGLPISFVDVLGMEYELPYEEVFQHVLPALDNLCTVVTDKIMEANTKAPAAVFLVGGASKIPTIAAMFSEKLKMDNKRVAVGGSMSIRKTIVSEKDVFHPEYVTPLGIVLTALRSKGSDGLAVTINGKRSQMMIKGSTSVIDILLASGYQYQQMIASSGKNLIYTWNGQEKILRGSYATPSVILVNEKQVNVFTQIKGGDNISFRPSVPGSDAKATISQLSTITPFSVSINSSRFQAGIAFHVNGVAVSADYEVRQGDRIDTISLVTLKELCEYAKIQWDALEFSQEGKVIDTSYVLRPNDHIVSRVREHVIKVDSAMKKALEAETRDNHDVFVKEDKRISIYQPNEQSKPDHNGNMQVVVNGKATMLEPRPQENPYVFLDMLNYIDIDMKQVRGDVILKLNGKDASYLDPIANGDEVFVSWTGK